MNPRWPLYIVSKGRWESRITARTLHRLGVPFTIIVEAQERAAYEAVIEGGTVLTLDPEYQRRYDTCDHLGEAKSRGSGAARNFAWDHAIAAGADWHWVMDDNIWSFHRFHENSKIPIGDGTMFRVLEDFCLRFRNLAMAGPAYEHFTIRRQLRTPFVLNTRIFSCNLIRNDVPFRWRARYNEDADLSLRMLKGRWCTLQSNALLQNKAATKKIRGGNTEALYGSGTLEKSRMLVRLHPDVTRLVHRYGRWHHHIDFSGFTHTLAARDGAEPRQPNEYGMTLRPAAETDFAKPAAAMTKLARLESRRART